MQSRPRPLFWWLLALVILAGILLRASHVYDEHRLTPNERSYLYFAGRIYDEGLGVNRALFREYNNDPDMWADVPPIRIGYEVILAGAMKVMRTKELPAGMALSFLASVLTIAIVAWLGLRFFNPWISLTASALYATFFSEIWLVRGTPEDGVFGLFSLLCLWITCEIMRTPRRWWLYAFFHVAGIWAILIKQSGIYLYGACALWLLGFLLFHEKSPRRALALAAGVAGALAVMCGMLVALAGNGQAVMEASRHGFLCNDECWAYQYECCFGPWIQIPRALFLLSPATFVLAIAGVIALALPTAPANPLNTLQRNCGGVLALTALGFISLFSFFPNMQSVRYLTPANGAVCLLGGTGLWSFLTTARRYMARTEYAILIALAVVGVLGSMVRDYRVFDRVAMQARIPELGAELIRSAMGR